jgi:hypothetical protein
MLTPVVTIVVGLCVVAVLLLLYALGRMFRKAAPNQAIQKAPCDQVRRGGHLSGSRNLSGAYVGADEL